jgi:hypothetical protein
MDHCISYHIIISYYLIRSADGTCRVWGLSDAAKARDVEDGVEIPIMASVMPHAQYIGACVRTYSAWQLLCSPVTV